MMTPEIPIFERDTAADALMERIEGDLADGALDTALGGDAADTQIGHTTGLELVVKLGLAEGAKVALLTTISPSDGISSGSIRKPA